MCDKFQLATGRGFFRRLVHLQHANYRKSEFCARENRTFQSDPTNRRSPVDATTLEPCQIKFVEGEDVLKLLQDNSQLALTAARILGHEIGMAFRDVHDLMMARSSTEKLAQLLISWVANEPDTPEPRVASDFTHEEKRR